MKLMLPVTSGLVEIEIELDESTLRCSAFADEVREVEIAIPEGVVPKAIRCRQANGEILIRQNGGWTDPKMAPSEPKAAAVVHPEPAPKPMPEPRPVEDMAVELKKEMQKASEAPGAPKAPKASFKTKKRDDH